MSSTGYYRNPDDLESYRNKSTFLASLNNEDGNEETARVHKQRMLELEGLLLIMFEMDETVFPKEGQIFGELSASNKYGMRELIEMEDTELYKKDLIGIRELNESGRMGIVRLNYTHVIYRQTDVLEHFLPFLQV